MSLDRHALNRWITGGNIRNTYIVVECPRCGEETALVCEIEFGTTIWSRYDCPRCKRDYTGTERWYEDLEQPEISI